MLKKKLIILSNKSLIFKNSKKNLLKQIAENTAPQTNADTAAIDMNTKAIYENDIARKQKVSTEAYEAEMDRLKTQSTIQLTQAQMQETAATAADTAANEVQTNSEVEQLMVKAGLISAEKMETAATVEASLADIQLAINSKAVTLAEGQQIATTLGLDAAQLKAAGSSKFLGKSLGLIKDHPIITAITAIVAVIGIFGESAEEAKEKAEAFTESLEEFSKTSKSNKVTLSNLEDRYLELSEGVSKLGENLYLTTKEYDEYKGLVSQISDIMPTLSTYYNEQGEAIGFVQGKLESLNAEYDKYIRNEALNLWINGDENGNTIQDTIDSINNLSDLSWFDDLGYHVKSNIFDGEFADLSDDLPVTEIIPLLEKIENLNKSDMESYFGDSDKDGNLDTDGAAVLEDILNVDGSDISSMSDAEFNEFKKQIQLTLQGYKDELDFGYRQIANATQTAVMKDIRYEGLTSETKSTLNNFMSNMTSDMVKQIGGFDINEGDIEVYDITKFADKLLTYFSDVDFTEAINSIYSIDYKNSDKTIKEVRSQLMEYIKYISEKIGLSKTTLLKLFGFNMLGFSNDDANTLNAVSNKFGLSTEELINNFNISDLEMAYDKINPIRIKSIRDLKSEIEKLKIQNLPTFGDIWNDNEHKEAKESLLELAKSGELTAKALASDDYDEFMADLEGIGVSAEEAKNEILSLLDATDKLAGVAQGLSGLESAYEEFKDKGYVTAETLQSIPEIFNKLETYNFDLFKHIVGNPERNVDEIQNAFNEIVTAYIKEQGLLTDITEHNAERFKSNLTEMGIVNADEVVRNVLAIKDSVEDGIKELADETEDDVKRINNLLTGMGKEAATSTNDLTECTWEEINALINAANAYSFTTDKIHEYALKKIWSNQNKINTKEDITQLLIIAKSAGIASKAIARYEEAKRLAEQGYGGGQGYVDALMKQAYQEILDDIESLYNFEFEMPEIEYTSPDDSSSSSGSDFDWIETKITRMDEALSRLDNKVSDTYLSWEQRNKSLENSISKTTEAIELQENAYKAYMNEANSVGLSDTYKSLVQKGALRIEDITNEDLADKVSEYQDLYEKAIQCQDTAEELRRTLNELSTSKKWELFKAEYDANIDVFDADIESLQTKLDKLDLEGMFANSSYYTNMESLTRKKINTLTTEANQLTQILSTMKQGEEYDTMFSELLDLRNQIAELENDCIEFNNNIRDLDWEIFSYLEESLNRITDEAKYLIGILEKEDLFNDSGIMTEYGKATIGLHASAYEVYTQQAKDYYEQVQDLQKKMLSGEGGDELISQYNEMVDAHREAVNAANDEKQAILDLVEEGYQKQLDSLNELIDKKKEAMNAEKDLYDYQKSIEEKTKTRDSLQKQYDIYKNDLSEEGIAKAQQLKVELESAQEDLEETEYEKYLSDQEAMLDALSEDYEIWMNERLDDEDELLRKITEEINTQGTDIKNTLNEVAEKNGSYISESMKTIFGEGSVFSTVMNGVSIAITNLQSKISELTTTSSDKTTTASSAAQTQISNNKTTTNTTNASNNTKNNSSNNSNSSNNNSNNSSNNANGGDWSSWIISKKDYYPKENLNKDTSIIDLLKYHDYDSSVSARALYYSKLGGSGTFTNSAAQNTWLLKKFKEKGYKSGTSNAKAGLRWTHENNLDELIIRKSDGAILTPLGRGDKVLNNDSTNVLYKFAEDPSAYIENLGLNDYVPQFDVMLPVMPNINGNGEISPIIDMGGINIVCNEVNNADDIVNDLITNKKFEKAMYSMVGNRMSGKNSMSKYRHV